MGNSLLPDRTGFRGDFNSRAKDDQRLLGLLKQAWLESGGVYGYRKLTLDMRDLGERCGKHRVARLLKAEGFRSKTGYGRKPGVRGGKPSVVAPSHLQLQFTVNAGHAACNSALF